MGSLWSNHLYDSTTTADDIIDNEKPDLTGKFVIITGPTSGIGVDTAVAMAKTNCTLILACRNLELGNNLKNELLKYNKKVDVIKLDLKNFESIDNFINEYKSKNYKIDILINNAGAVGSYKYELTEDGYEYHMFVNCIAPFYLTVKLLPIIRESINPRVVFVTSLAHYFSNPFLSLNPSSFCYNPFTAYGNSKMAILLLANELSRKEGPNVHIYSVHPGVIKTKLAAGLSFGMENSAGFLYKSPQQGAATTIYCAVSDECKSHSGCYYNNSYWGLPRLDTYLSCLSSKLFQDVCNICCINDYKYIS